MITTDEMRKLEDLAESKGISKLTLMENAGRKAAEIIQDKFDISKKSILVVCYHGNNGGDGFVVARYLAEKTEVDVLFLSEEGKLKPEALKNFKKIEADPMVQFISLDYVNFDDYDIIIDAILGIGIQGALKPILKSTIDLINSSSSFKISLDIPSGLDPDTGEIASISIAADMIITFHDIKKGLVNLTDKTFVADIGIPR